MQNDICHRWFLLDDQHADYAATIADLQAVTESHGRTYSNVAGAVANTRVVYGYMTAAEIAAQAPSLTIGTAAVLDRMEYATCINPMAAPASLRTSPYGDAHVWYGKFLRDPEPLPTWAVDRIVADWKGLGSDSVLYVAQTARGAADGSSYANACAIANILSHTSASPTIDPTAYTIMVLCGVLSRFKNEGGGPQFGAEMYFAIKTGTDALRTAIIAHPVDGGALMGGCKLGSGESGGTFNEDAAWADEADATWSCGHTDHLTTTGFVLSDAGGTLRALTPTASVAACKALADSYYTTSTKTYVHLADGSNPHQTTYFGIHNFNGVRFKTVNTTHFDFFGVRIPQQNIRGVTYHGQNSDYGFYGCRAGYFPAQFVQVLDPASYDIPLGTFSTPPHQPSNRKFRGNVIEYFTDGIYDACNFGFVPLNTLIADNYFRKIGVNEYGVQLGTTDSHSCANQGARGWYNWNNCYEECGSSTIQCYPNGVLRDATPSGKEATDLYTIGWPIEHCSVNFTGEGGFALIYHQPLHDIQADWNLIISPVTFSDNSALNPEGQGISFAGDNRHFDFNGQILRNTQRNNRVEGPFTLGAYRNKWKPTSHLDVEISDNVALGAVRAFDLAVSTATDGSGNTIDPSVLFLRNKLHATDLHVNLGAVGGDHTQILQNQTYYNDDSGDWQHGATRRTTLAAWQGDTPAGDDYDTGSTETAIPQSTDVATISIDDTTPIVGQTLTATFNDDDADGAGSTIRYEWRSNDRVVGGANSATYIVRPQDIGFALKAVAFYTSGGNRKVCISSATSNVGAGTYARKAVAIAA